MIDRDRVLAYIRERTQVGGQDECWNWTGAISSGSGRPVMVIDNQFLNPHQMSYYLRYGEWPAKGIFVCHTCDNPLCMNPDHLFLGTNTDNVHDASRKGKMIGVPRERRHVLEGKGQEIRDLYASGNYTQGQIASMYGVTRQAINKICCGRRRAGNR